jgi:hypothetical protein
VTLQKRLAKLEARHQVLQTGGRIIINDLCWRDDEGNLKCIAQVAKVLTPVGWQIVNRGNNESEAAFHLRVESMNSSDFTCAAGGNLLTKSHVDT